MKGFRQRLHDADTANLWLLAGLLLTLLPHLLRLPLFLSIVAGLLLSWRLAHELYQFRLPNRPLRWLLALLAAIAIYSSFHSLVGRQAGVALLVLLLCLKLLEMSGHRDFSLVCYLGFFLISGVFLFSQSILIGITMLLAAALLLTALIRHYRGHNLFPARTDRQKSLMILAQALPLAILLFVLFPRIPGPLWQLPDDSTRATTGLSDAMSPGTISQLSNDDSVAFRVRFDGPEPAAKSFYWRGPVLTVFDGRSWFNPNHKSPVSRQQVPQYRASNQPVSYSVTLEPHRQRWLFALDLPALLPADSVLSPDYEIIARNKVQQLRRYRMRSFPRYVLAQNTPPPSQPYLQLPKNVGKRARILAQELLAKAGSKNSMVEQVLQYFRQQPFYYTRQPPRLNGDLIDEFLFSSRRGYCEHYAASLVFLMRSVGIPARVVTGYRGGEKNPLSDYYIIRQSTAHAWAEVWLVGKGWLRVDPTTAIPASRIENELDRLRFATGNMPALSPGWGRLAWRQFGFAWDRVNRGWNQWIIQYNNRQQQAFLSKFFSGLGLSAIDWQKMILMLLFSMFTIVAIYAWRLLRNNPPISKDPIQRSYARYCRKLGHRGLVRHAAEGAKDFSRRAQQQFPEQRMAIMEITRLYNRLRYAPTPKQENIKCLQSAVRRFPGLLHHRAKIVTRFFSIQGTP